MANGPTNIPEPIRPAPVQQTQRPAPKKPEFKPAPQPELQPSRDTVELSPRAREIQTLLPRIQAQPEVRPARVEEARAQVGRGGNDASVNAKIAERLLTEQ